MGGSSPCVGRSFLDSGSALLKPVCHTVPGQSHRCRDGTGLSCCHIREGPAGLPCLPGGTRWPQGPMPVTRADPVLLPPSVSKGSFQPGSDYVCFPWRLQDKMQGCPDFSWQQATDATCLTNTLKQNVSLFVQPHKFTKTNQLCS